MLLYQGGNKPPICWLGGKSRSRKRIIEQMPPDHVCYVEVFGGAGWVLFGKERSRVEVYNDFNGCLVNFFRVIRNQHDEFIKRMEYELVSRRSFDEYKQALRSDEPLSDLERAFYFFYLFNYSFGGQGGHFGTSKVGKLKKKLFDVELIRKAWERLQPVTIENLDFRELIKRYDGPGTLFYCDPPYFETAGYDVPFGWNDQKALRDILGRIQGRFMLSINDHEKIRELYQGFDIAGHEVTYSVGKQKQSRKGYGELLVSSF